MVKTESKVTYDDRRKKLTHQVDSEHQLKNSNGEVIGVTTNTVVGTYNEEGIRSMLNELEDDKEQLEDDIKEFQEKLEDFKEVKDTKELKKLIENLNNISRLRQKEQIEGQLQDSLAKLKVTRENLNQIKKVIGSRLKL